MSENKNYLQILNSCKIDNSTPIPDDNIYLSIDSQIIGSSGNFINIVGLPKSCKSTFLAGIIASTISNSEVYGMKVITYKHLNKYKIAVFDTEQSPLDFQNKARMIKKLAKTDNIYENLDVFSVVEQSEQDIIYLIFTYLKHNPECCILAIDGVLDLITDFNSEKESKRLIKIIRKLAKQFDVLIILILHLGKKDRTAIGHLGSSATRYCQSELEIEKTKDNTYVLSGKNLRSAGYFEPIQIIYSEKSKMFIQI